jgi:hypothetical protein
MCFRTKVHPKSKIVAVLKTFTSFRYRTTAFHRTVLRTPLRRTHSPSALAPRTNAHAHTSKASPQTAPQSDFESATATTLRDNFLSDCECDFWAASMGLSKCDCATKKDQRNGVLDYARCDALSKQR